MLAKRLLSQVFDDDLLTRGLGDPEARVLVEWLVERAEALAAAGMGEQAAHGAVVRFRRRGRSISRFVALWCHLGERGAAGQLATAERLNWPLPDADVDPCELMQNILAWEDRQMRDLEKAGMPPDELAGWRATA
jgi:hypothetical protein